MTTREVINIATFYSRNYELTNTSILFNKILNTITNNHIYNLITEKDFVTTDSRSIN